LQTSPVQQARDRRFTANHFLPPAFIAGSCGKSQDQAAITLFRGEPPMTQIRTRLQALVVAALTSATVTVFSGSASAQGLIILISPSDGERAQVACDSKPPRGASRDWLKQHCKPADPKQATMGDSFFDVFIEIEIP
jgi:hypothetical protein